MSRVLIAAFDYPPQLGGVATYSAEISKCIANRPQTDLHLVIPHQSHAFISQNPELNNCTFFHKKKRAYSSLNGYSHAIRRAISKFKPDIIICPLWFPDAVSVVMANTEIPFTISCHGKELFFNNYSVKDWFRKMLLWRSKKLAFNKAHHIFSVSQFTESLVLNQFPKASTKSTVVTNGVNLKRFQPVLRSVDSSEKSKVFKFISVSRLLPHKGIDQFINCVRMLVNQQHSVVYNIVGDGPDRDRLEKLVLKKNLNEHVFFSGALSHQDLCKAYDSSDALVMASRFHKTHMEGFGLVALEAGIFGLPTIGTLHGGIPDAVENNKTGLLVDENDDAALANAAIRLIKDPDFYERLSEAALEKAQSSGWSLKVEELLKAASSQLSHGIQL